MRPANAGWGGWQLVLTQPSAQVLVTRREGTIVISRGSRDQASSQESISIFENSEQSSEWAWKPDRRSNGRIDFGGCIHSRAPNRADHTRAEAAGCQQTR